MLRTCSVCGVVCEYGASQAVPLEECYRVRAHAWWCMLHLGHLWDSFGLDPGRPLFYFAYLRRLMPAASGAAWRHTSRLQRVETSWSRRVKNCAWVAIQQVLWRVTALHARKRPYTIASTRTSNYVPKTEREPPPVALPVHILSLASDSFARRCILPRTRPSPLCASVLTPTDV